MDFKKRNSRIKDPVWQKIPTQGQDTRSEHTSTLYDHYIIVIGGLDQNRTIKETEEILIFDTLTYQWQKPSFEGIKPQNHSSHTACLFDVNKVIVYGGEINGRIPNHIFLITITQGSHQDISLNIEGIKMNEKDPRRSCQCAQVFGDKMYVFGGADPQGTASDELWSLDLKGFKWTQHPQQGATPSARFRHDSTLISNKMYVFGGRTNPEPISRMNDVFSLNLDTLNWIELKCTGTVPSPRSSMSLIQHHGLLYVFGGYTINDVYSNELFSLNLKDNKWKCIETKNECPSERASSRMISYENGIFFLGGDDEAESFSDFFFLNLISSYKEKKLLKHLDHTSQLYLNSLYSDVVFLVQDKRIFAHKMLLGTYCQYFSKMFSSGMLEADQKEIKIQECKAETFEAFLKYIYCGEVEFTDEIALDLFVLCNKWLFKELEEECEDYLAETLTLENALERTKLADKFEAQGLTNALLSFIIDNIIELEKRGDLYKMPPVINVKIMLEQTARLNSYKSTT